MKKAVIFGCGFSGAAIAKVFIAAGFVVVGTTRSEEKLAALTAIGVRGHLFDGATVGDPLRADMAEATVLIQSISPGDGGDPLLRLSGADIRSIMPKLEWIGYLSTIGVYGDHKGTWIDETIPLTPGLGRSVNRVEAEDGWMAIGVDTGIPVAILRLSGIYGPGRNAFVNLDRGTARRLIKKDQVFNRIRVEDIARSTLFLSEHNLSGIFNVTDDRPAPPQDIIVEAARLMGIEPPPEQDFEAAELSPMARSFYGENKRVSNAKLKAAGYVFAFPDYIVSLEELWQQGHWRG